MKLVLIEISLCANFHEKQKTHKVRAICIAKFILYILDIVICRNLELKMKCQELQIMQLTYTPDANRALSKIAHQFNEKISESEKHQAQLRGELEHYQSLGKSFDDIAERYSKVLEELQHVEWMLNSMNKCDEKEKNS